MTQYKEDPYVGCPYYCKESATDIRCKGIIGNHTTSDFPNKVGKIEHKTDFCMDSKTAQGCPIYCAIREQEEWEQGLNESSKM